MFVNGRRIHPQTAQVRHETDRPSLRDLHFGYLIARHTGPTNTATQRLHQIPNPTSISHAAHAEPVAFREFIKIVRPRTRHDPVRTDRVASGYTF